MVHYNSIHCCVLGAGASSRFGSVKQLYPIDGISMMDRALFNLQTVKSHFINCYTSVILGAHYTLIQPAIKRQCKIQSTDILYNANWQQGISSSIHIAVKHSMDKGCNGLLITLADQPYIAAEELIALLKSGLANNIAAAEYGDRVGVPAYFDSSYFSRLLILQGDLGAGKLLNNEKVRRCKFNNLSDMDRSPETFLQ